MYRKIKPIVSVERLKEELPIPKNLNLLRQNAVKQIEDILSGADKRKLVIIGPCSADNAAAVCDFADRLSRVAEKIKDRIFVVMRVHTSKPRTRGEGYMGMIHTPDISSDITDINAGLKASRALHLRVASESGIFTSDELLYPDCAEYISDTVVYMTLGARSAESQTHRFAASAVEVPIGVKNSPSGSVYDLSGSVHAVSMAHEFMISGYQVRSGGNKFAHAVLRGAVDLYGNNIPNYGIEYVRKYVEIHAEQSDIIPSVIIDTGHANSGKVRMRQAEIVDETFSFCASDDVYNAAVKGFMIESYIEDGNQSVADGVYGKSITDPCMGWNKTEKLLIGIADKINI